MQKSRMTQDEFAKKKNNTIREGTEDIYGSAI